MTLTMTDLFSGGGGSSEGMTQAGVHVQVAANHWDTAIATHQKNHPDTEHIMANLSEVDWRTFRPPTFSGRHRPACGTHGPAAGNSRRRSRDAAR